MRVYNGDMEEHVQTIREWLGSGSINLFGRPFCGKDTQGERLAEALQAPLIGGGDILRSHHDPAQIEKVMAEGGLIPSDFYFELVLPYLSQEQFRGKPLVLDAVGRSSGEEPTIVRAAEQSGHPIKAVIALHITEVEVWKRFDSAMKNDDRGPRPDDDRDVLKNRLAKYQEKTLPVIEFYREKGLLIEVDGTGHRDDVTEALILQLYKFATRSAER